MHSEYDRILGTLVGCAIGDAMGMPGEMWSRSRIQKTFGRICDFLPGHPDHEISAGFKPGETTDDTIVTVLVAKALIRSGGDLPPLELREGSMTLTVGGKIDRVDGYVRGDTLYLKVVDYKTGKKEFRLSDLLYGLNLQMFLYLMMLQQAELPAVLQKLGVDAKRIQPCGALYIPARAPFAAAEPGMSPEDVQKLTDRELRRIGLVLDDSDLLEAMENGGKFRFLPVSLLKNGGFSASSCVASTAQLGRLLRKTEDNLRHIARQIAEGDIEASPYRVERDKTACQYCDFKEACHFDPTLKKDQLRFLPAEPPARVYEILEEEQDGKEAQA